MKKLLLLLAFLVCFSKTASGQQIVNGSESFVPGGWIASQVPNAGSTGTTVNMLAKLTAGTAVLATTADTSNVEGIVGAGAGTTGNAAIVKMGQVGCVFDGATTANDYVIESISVNGDCSDGGSVVPAVQSFGRVLSTNASGGTYQVLVTPHTGTITVASGASALGTSAITSGACASAVTASATGVLTTDNIQADFNSDPTSTTGYQPLTTGTLTIIKYPTANTVNFKVCNNTANSITPGAVTLNWRVVR